MSVAGLCTCTVTFAVACGLATEDTCNIATPALEALMFPLLLIVTASPRNTDHFTLLSGALDGSTSIIEFK